MYFKYFKRVFDVIFSVTGFIILLPFFVIIAVILKLTLKSNPFFIQSRPGRNRKVFNLIKFKTMNDKRDNFGALLPDNVRITKTGAFLRSFSLDELPQLINVIKGDMSLVGPRPLLIKYLPLYNERQAMRHKVKPGITGLAQIKGRNIIEWTDRLEMDAYYVENVRFLLDMKILFNTFIKVIRREGINVSEDTTMNTFTGNNR